MLEDKMFNKMIKITELERDLEEDKKKNIQEGAVKVNPFDEYCRKFGGDKIRQENFTKGNNNIERRRALELYGRKPTIAFKEDLALIQEHRRKRDQP